MANKARKIMRQSIHAFCQHFQPLTATAVIFAIPNSAALFVSQALLSVSSSSVLQPIAAHLQLLFEAAGLPENSEFFSFLNLKISQSIFTFTFTLPFTLTFLIAARASVVQTLHRYPWHKSTSPPLSAILRLYPQILQTQFSSFAILISLYAINVFLVLISFNLIGILGGLPNGVAFTAVSAVTAITYSVAIAYASMVCNLAMTISALKRPYTADVLLMKAWMAIKDNSDTPLFLSIAANLGMAAVEALFQYRVVKPNFMSGRGNGVSGNPFTILLECSTIVYMHSMLVVLDFVIGYMFLKSCKADCLYQNKAEAKLPLTTGLRL